MALKTTTQKSSSKTHRQSGRNSWCWVSGVGLIIITVLGIIAGYPFIAPSGLAAQMNQGPVEDAIRDPSQPWRLEADEINYDQNFDEYSAKGLSLIHI